MNIAPASALAAWAVGTAWLALFFVLERLDPYLGKELIDWIQVASALLVLTFYPAFRKMFSAWLDKRP